MTEPTVSHSSLLAQRWANAQERKGKGVTRAQRVFVLPLIRLTDSFRAIVLIITKIGVLVLLSPLKGVQKKKNSKGFLSKWSWGEIPTHGRDLRISLLLFRKPTRSRNMPLIPTPPPTPQENHNPTGETNIPFPSLPIGDDPGPSSSSGSNPVDPPPPPPPPPPFGGKKSREQPSSSEKKTSSTSQPPSNSSGSHTTTAEKRGESNARMSIFSLMQQRKNPPTSPSGTQAEPAKDENRCITPKDIPPHLRGKFTRKQVDACRKKNK